MIAERVVGPSAGRPDGAGELLLRGVLSVWDDPGARPALLAMVRRVMEPGGEQLFRDGFVRVVLLPLGEAIGVDRPQLRMSLVASQVLGLIVLRYVVRLEPLASLDVDALVAAYAPAVQRYLSGPLG
ncbi:hypothetical protein MF408_07045 [Nocardioides sp. TF02-7]|nr:hypothetical protein MF408_07045 [Nocardioides sp. TF02-7]